MMVVYVDPIGDYTATAAKKGLRHTHWCHLLADTRDEIHAFADRLGLRRAWFQDDVVAWHYDITPPKRSQAIRLGAREITLRESSELLSARRTQSRNPQVPGIPQQAPESAPAPAGVTPGFEKAPTDPLWKEKKLHLPSDICLGMTPGTADCCECMWYSVAGYKADAESTRHHRETGHNVIARPGSAPESLRRR